MLKMNYWTDKWDLHEDICPCDVHVNEWIAEKAQEQAIYHFGTGTHHVVGPSRRRTAPAMRWSHHRLDRGIPGLYQARHRERAGREILSGLFRRHLSDQSALLPDFDVVTMLHLCEFFFPNTASKEYGGLTDRKVLDLFTDKTKRRPHHVLHEVDGRGENRGDHSGMGKGEARRARRRIQDAFDLSEEISGELCPATQVSTTSMVSGSNATMSAR